MAEHAIELPTAWGQLSGTLLLPEGAGPWTAALLVATATTPCCPPRSTT
jgi:hypothetical protein